MLGAAGMMVGSRPLGAPPHVSWSLPSAANNNSEPGFYQRLGECCYTCAGTSWYWWSSGERCKYLIAESTRAKIDFYSERLKQLAGTNFTKLTEVEETEDTTATGHSKVSSSSSKTDDEKEENIDDNISKSEQSNDQNKNDTVNEEDCVPDSSNNNDQEEETVQEEQHSSGSVDEELLEEDENTDTKTSVEEAEASEEGKDSEKTDCQNSLVRELMNKFGFSNILEYQEAYRKAVEESKEQILEEANTENNNDQSGIKTFNGIKLRSDITMDSKMRNFSKSELIRNFETLKRLRPDLNGPTVEKETLFAGSLVNDHIYRMVKERYSNIWPNQTIVSDQSELTILLCQPMIIYVGY